MTKARQRERAKRRKLIARNLTAVPISNVHGYIDGVEHPIDYWDGKKIRFVSAPPKGSVVTIKVDTRVMEGIKCQ